MQRVVVETGWSGLDEGLSPRPGGMQGHTARVNRSW